MKQIIPVVLCGGSGTRLWPLSRKSFPKQFAELIGDSSLLDMTLRRVKALGDRVVTVAAEDHRFMVVDAMQRAGTTGSLILESTPRNTAAAMALAALGESSPDELLLFCPADHHIPDVSAFVEMVQSGVAAAEAGAIVTFGVVPSLPSTAYGYIRFGEKQADGSFPVVEFIEKPPADKAQALLLSGDVLWNAGIFLCKASTLIDALARFAPDILECCQQAMLGAQKDNAPSGHTFVRPDAAALKQCRSQSIDFAVIERHSNVVVFPFRGQWSDVGSWNAVADLAQPDERGNRVHGRGFVHKSSNTFIRAPHRPVVALGTEDLVIVDTPDAVLVASRHCAEDVKEVVSRLETEQYVEAVAHRKVARPWGWYDALEAGERFQVKRIGVRPGAALSLQKHHHRAEHWIVVKGVAEVTRGNETFLLSENQSTYIPIGEVHRLRNPGKVELEIIEIQSGSYLGEDDIIRLEDTYGRA
ncbi:mannose-1-phosphate guanylyltransferase/mannose-6-phosphate isomerase [Pandoraea norimbergensis]|uniref:mannose-1-phosphate guanylyltransferase n=1 Tax=Pandoraea norimbergensis TaxID=93219 RepID=A0ABM5WGS1_9BURK|nr:mannose-1-phosphate guanylyltransferase/mannose-6-phosphate isomerase [Pandoraea norimbergensis]ALS59552.1 mannose-1-phosphate guanylyltransferase/mannose-6-phosphate isomerase [Pandoraea norimbergensis]